MPAITTAPTCRRRQLHQCSALLVALFLPSITLAQKTPDVRIDLGSPPGSAESYAPRLAASGSLVYVTWADFRNSLAASDIYFNRSVDRGATWLSADIRLDTGSLPGASHSAGHDIVATEEAVYVTWHDTRSVWSDIYFNRSLDGGETWLPTDVRLDVGSAIGAAHSLHPSIAAIGSGVYVAWQDHRNGVNGDIYFNRSLDAGSTWLPTDIRLDVGSAPGAAGSGTVRTLVSNSVVYVTWSDARSGTNHIYLNRSLDEGTSWMASDVRLDVGSPQTEIGADLDYVAAFGSLICAVWKDGRNGFDDIFLNRSLDAGATWMPVDVRLDVGSPPGTSQSHSAVVAATAAGVYAAWTDFREGSSHIYFNRSGDNGSTWLPTDARLDNTSGLGHSPSIIALGSSVFVAWLDERNGGNKDVFFNRSLDAGLTWLPTDVRLDVGSAAGGAYSYALDIAGSSSSVYVTWQDLRNDPGCCKYDIYFNLASGCQPYGQGLAGSGGIVPTIKATGDFAIGGRFTVQVERGRGGAIGRLFASLSGPAMIPFVGGTLLVAPPLFRESLALDGLPETPGGGSASKAFAVPLDLRLIGIRVNVQAGILDPDAIRGAALTGGLELWIL